ncbi:MAG TPA: hypothetical protein VEA60_10000 [Allosphingosinicella sp.]|nr:hypothetical protein [Allosphingosinicella sp.]
MAMNLIGIRFWVLDVGQGACNYVELYDSPTHVAYNMLVDLGTNSSFAVATPAVNWLTNQIKDRPDPKVNVMLLTHGDTDHFNLVSRLFPALGPPSQAQIGMVRFGGMEKRYTVNRQWDPKRSLITALKAYCPDVLPMGTEWSSYTPGDPPTWTRIWPATVEAGDAQLFVFMANAPHAQDESLKSTRRKDHNAEATNAKSLVFGLLWANRLFVGTGDATAATLSKVNALIPVLGVPTTMLTMPHHGSRKTTYDLKSADNIPDHEAVQVVQTFLDIFKPWTISISADEKGHHHPSLATIEQFSRVTTPTPFWKDPSLADNRHYLTAWIDWNLATTGATPWPTKWQYGTLETSSNLYCTLYYTATMAVGWVSPPIPGVELSDMVLDSSTPTPRGMNWAFTVLADGSLSMLAEPNSGRPPTTFRMSFAGMAPASGPARSAAARSQALFAGPAPADPVQAAVRLRPRGRRIEARRDGIAATIGYRLSALKPIA